MGSPLFSLQLFAIFIRLLLADVILKNAFASSESSQYNQHTRRLLDDQLRQISRAASALTSESPAENPKIRSLLDGIQWTSDVSIDCAADVAFFVKELGNYWMKSSALRNAEASSVAYSALQKDVDGLSWTIRLLDALGKPGSGVLMGNTFWLGNYKECVAIDVPRPSYKPFVGKYCLRKSSLGTFENAKQVFLNYGLCLPYACSNKDAAALFTSESASQVPNLTQEIVAEINNAAATYACHEPLSLSSDPLAISMIFILSVLAVLLIAGTCIDLNERRQMGDSCKAVVNVHLQDEKKATNEASGNHSSIEDKLPKVEENSSKASKAANSSNAYMEFVCGIRVLAMWWIILAHTYYYAADAYDNLLVVSYQIREFIPQFLNNASVAVDVFLFLSGLLLAYIWFRDTQKKSGKNISNPAYWLVFYVHRWIRLTPVYMLILALDVAFTGYLANGPLWNQEGIEVERCANTWVYNLLYVNNFFGIDKMCISHSWYLALDMQIYLLSPIVLVLLYRFRAFAITVAVAAIIASGGLYGYLTVAYNFPPNSIVTANMIEYNYDQVEFFQYVYTVPWTRCGPYIIGILLGWILCRLQKKSVHVHKVVNLLCWITSIAIMLAVIFGIFEVSRGTRISPLANGFYSAANRSLFAAAVGWIIFACTKGYGHFVNAFLSWNLFKPLSRLTYCTYLVHPIIIRLAYFGRDTAFHFDSHYTMLCYFFGHTAVSYLVAFIFSLAMESPVIGLERVLLFRDKKNESGRNASAAANLSQTNNDPFVNKNEARKRDNNRVWFSKSATYKVNPSDDKANESSNNSFENNCYEGFDSCRNVKASPL